MCISKNKVECLESFSKQVFKEIENMKNTKKYPKNYLRWLKTKAAPEDKVFFFRYSANIKAEELTFSEEVSIIDNALNLSGD